MGKTSLNQNLKAMLLALGGFSAWVGCDVCIKLTGQSGLPFYQMIFIMTVSGTLCVTAVTAWRGRLAFLKPKRWGFEIGRSVLQLLGATANVFAFTNLPLTNIYVVVFVSPLLIALLAAQFLGEKLVWKQIAAIIVGFIGVVVAIAPAKIDFSGGNAIGYAALPFCLLTYVLGMFLTRLAGRSESADSMTFFPQLVRALLTLPFFWWNLEAVSLHQLVTMAICGLFSALGFFLINSAMKLAKAGLVSAFHYSQIVVGATVGYLIWGDVPSMPLVIGAFIIIASGIYMIQHSHRQKVQIEEQI